MAGRCVQLVAACGAALLATVVTAGDLVRAGGSAVTVPTDRADAAARSRPPDAAACPRDHLTSYDGRVLRYSRHAGRDGHTTLQIRTDWDTTETLRLAHPGQPDASRWFLLAGQPFAPGDLARIEAGRDRLRPGWRVVAWVCDDGRPPLVDWQPPPH